MDVIRRILALQSVFEGLQDRAGVIRREDLGQKELRGDEVGGEEIKQGCPEKHYVEWGLRGDRIFGGKEKAGRKGGGN